MMDVTSEDYHVHVDLSRKSEKKVVRISVSLIDKKAFENVLSAKVLETGEH
jgi:hypothetical protein